MIRDFFNTLYFGSDERSSTVGGGSTNVYGSPFYPNRDLVDYGSCTSATITEPAYQSAESVCSRLNASYCHNDLEAHRKEFAKIRGVIEKAFQLTEGASPMGELIFTPSGTDAEFVPVILARQIWGDVRIVNILVGGDELGRGSTRSARGERFSEFSPNGSKFTASEINNSFISELHNIPLRNEQGEIRSELEVKKEIAVLVRRLIQQGDKIILHQVVSSKTGLVGPSSNTISELETEFNSSSQKNILIVVDLAQGRFAQTLIAENLKRDHIVFSTGSKFFGGPSFCGLVILPSSLVKLCLREEMPILETTKAYFCRSGFSNQLDLYSQGLPTEINTGLLLRWSAASFEMQSWFSLPELQRRQLFEEMNSALSAKGCSFSELEFLPLDTFVEVEAKSIHTFFVKDLGRDYELRELVQRMLSADGKKFRLGQPVRIKGDQWALRISWSAPLLRHYFSVESNVVHRKQKMTDDLKQFFEKLEIQRQIILSTKQRD